MEELAHGSSAEEIYEQHRGYLSLAQIHAAWSAINQIFAFSQGILPEKCSCEPVC
jgi:hypothetical protein